MQYALLGPYDFVTIVEPPNNETMAHLSVDLGSRGAVTISTMPAIDLPDFVAQLQQPEQLGRGTDPTADIERGHPWGGLRRPFGPPLILHRVRPE